MLELASKTISKENGNWTEWMEDDTPRLRRMKFNAVENYNERLCNDLQYLEETDSLDNASMAVMRHKAKYRKVIAGLNGWQGYTSYNSDFNESDAQSLYSGRFFWQLS